MDTSCYTYETPQLQCSFFSPTEDSVDLYTSSQDDGERTPRSASWDSSSSSFSGPSTPGYGVDYFNTDMNASQSFSGSDMQLSFVEHDSYPEQVSLRMSGTILRSNVLDCKPAFDVTALPFDGRFNSLALSGSLAALPADIFDPMTAGPDLDLSPPSTPLYQQPTSSYQLSSPIDMIDSRNDVYGGRKSSKSARKCKRTGKSSKSARKCKRTGNSSTGYELQRGKKPEPCPYYEKDGTKCTSRFEREEHFRRHKRTCHRDDCNPEELKAFPIEQCPLWHANKAGCKEILGNRHDNWCQHMATHVKGGGRNKAIDPAYLVFRMRRQYETDLQEHPEEIVSKLNPEERTIAALWSLFVNGVRERNKAAVKKETQPDLEYMRKLPDYADYVREVGQRRATENAGRNVWQMLEEEVLNHCFDRLLKTGRIEQITSVQRFFKPRL